MDYQYNQLNNDENKLAKTPKQKRHKAEKPDGQAQD